MIRIVNLKPLEKLVGTEYSGEGYIREAVRVINTFEQKLARHCKRAAEVIKKIGLPSGGYGIIGIMDYHSARDIDAVFDRAKELYAENEDYKARWENLKKLITGRYYGSSCYSVEKAIEIMQEAAENWETVEHERIVAAVAKERRVNSLREALAEGWLPKGEAEKAKKEIYEALKEDLKL